MANDDTEEIDSPPPIPATHAETRAKLRVDKTIQVARTYGEAYCDGAGNAWITTHSDQNGTGHVWLLPSSQFAEWLAFLADRDFGFKLTGAEIHQVVRILAGEARTNPPRPLDANAQLRVLEQHPLLQLVVEFVHEHNGDFEGPTANLRNRLSELARNRSVNCRLSSVPTSTKVLSQKLKRDASILRELGVLLHIRHTRTGSRTALRREPELVLIKPTTSLREPTTMSDSPMPQTARGVTHGDANEPERFEPVQLPTMDRDARDARDALEPIDSDWCGRDEPTDSIPGAQVPAAESHPTSVIL